MLSTVTHNLYVNRSWLFVSHLPTQPVAFNSSDRASACLRQQKWLLQRYTSPKNRRREVEINL